MRRPGYKLILLLLFIVVPALMTAEKRLEQLFFTQEPDNLKIYTNDSQEASDPVIVTVEDLETGQIPPLQDIPLQRSPAASKYSQRLNKCYYQYCKSNHDDHKQPSYQNNDNCHHFTSYYQGSNESY